MNQDNLTMTIDLWMSHLSQYFVHNWPLDVLLDFLMSSCGLGVELDMSISNEPSSSGYGIFETNNILEKKSSTL